MQPIQLMIAGAPKCATTSLLRYLGQHPGVCAQNSMELGYFVAESEFLEGYETAWERYFPCAQSNNSGVLFAKSVQIMYSSKAMQRLREHNPDVRIVLQLRNPVDRSYSDYWYARRRGWETIQTFEDALVASPERFGGDVALEQACAYLDRGSYLKYIQLLRDFFEADNLRHYLVDDFKRDPIKVCQEIFSLFETLDPEFTPNVVRRHNLSTMHRNELLARFLSTRSRFHFTKRLARQFASNHLVDQIRDSIRRWNEREFETPPMDSSTRERLVEYYRPLNDELAQYLGRDLSIWNI